MKRINSIVIWLTASLLIPVVANAAECIDLITQIRQDVRSSQSTFFKTTTFSQLVDKLGQPHKTNKQDEYYQYDWTCPEDNKSNLIVYTKDNSRIDSVGGTIYTNDGMASFGVANSGDEASGNVGQH